MKKTFRIGVLPTEAISRFWINDLQEGKLCEFSHPLDSTSGNKSQHFYITSPEKINNGDIATDGVNCVIVMGVSSVTFSIQSIDGSKFGTNDISLIKGLAKIVATTDKTLSLPEIPQPYLDCFISEYNNGNVIEEVELEMITASKLRLKNNEVIPVIPVTKINSLSDLSKLPDEWTINNEQSIEEAAKEYMKSILIPYAIIETAFKDGWEQGVKRKASKLYTEEEVLRLFNKLEAERGKYFPEDCIEIVPLDKWFEENKKK